ncbi:GspH/FimT family pseudopilin [Thauera sp. AutoDN2]|uniref:GspH/FimT family pseudopilin n=1 Tax=Thauera sp. AutoDN2 TaxID=3416051 RepID=UPI003F4B2CCA
MKKISGFTIVELMVTVAVAAILMMIAAPAFRDAIASYRLTTLTNELVAATRFARGEAIKLNRPVSFCRAAAANSTDCAGGAGANWADWVVSDGTSGIRRGAPEQLGNEFRVASNFGGDTVTYAPNGLPTANGVVTACTTTPIAENRRVITIGPGNRISVARAAGACP